MTDPLVISYSATLVVRPLDCVGGVSRYVVERPREELRREERAALERLGRTAAGRGFRRGALPVSMLEHRFGARARREGLHRFLEDSVCRALESVGVVPLTAPVVESVEEGESVVRVRLVVERAPDVELGRYKGLPLSRRAVGVSEEQIDAALCALGKAPRDPSVGEDSGELRGVLRRALRSEADRAARRDLENQAADRLLEDHPFELPPTPINELAADFLSRLEADHRAAGGPPAEWPERRRGLAPEVRREAERRLRLTYLLSGIAAAEGIHVTEAEAEEAVRRAVAWLPADQRAVVLARLTAFGTGVRSLLLEDKIYDFLIQHAVISEMGGGVCPA